MGAKRTAKKTHPAPRKAAAKQAAAPKKTAAKKAAAKKKAAATKPAGVPPPWTERGARIVARERRALTSGLAPEDLATRIAATGLVPTAYLLPWEPIHGEGGYAAIACALRDLAEGAFPITDVRDTVDLARPEAALELTLDGIRHVIDVQVRDAELDEGVLVVLGALFERRQEGQPLETRRYLFVDPSTCRKVHTYLLISTTFDAMFAINAATGAAFIKVTEL